MDWAYQISDNEAERFNTLAEATIEADATLRASDKTSDKDMWSNIFQFGAKVWQYW